MQREPHVEFIPFPEPEPDPAAVAPADATSDAPADATSDGPEPLIDLAATPAPEQIDPSEGSALHGDPVAPDEVLSPGDAVTVIGEDHPVEVPDLAPSEVDDPYPEVASDSASADGGDSDGGGDGDDRGVDDAVIDVTGEPTVDEPAHDAPSVGGSPAGDDPEDDGDTPAATVGGSRSQGRLPVIDTPIADRTEALRRWGIAGRLLLVPMAGIIFAVVVSLIATAGIAATSRVASQIGDAGRVARSGADLRSSLTQARDAAPPLDAALLDALLEQSGDTIDAVGDQAAPARTQALDDAVARLVEAARQDAGDVEVDGHAVTAIGVLDALLARVEATRAHRLDVLDHRRTATILAILTVLLVGSAVLLILTRSVAQSIVQPLRLLGRAMRRFADGDTSARGIEGVDEVGLLARSFNYSASAMGRRIERLSADAARGMQLRMISDALDLADNEADVHRITERALGIVAPGRAGQLLVTQSTSNRLVEVAANPQRPSPGCPVEAAGECVAMRRAQPVVFDSPAAINACPRLRGRPVDCAAACVPVSVNGHLLGVLHVTGAEHDPPEPETVEQLVTLAGQVGNRIGAMRTLEVTRMQASTDGLTGLANRRMLEARIADFMRNGTPFVLAVADLDHFTEINNNYGHEFGDKALQLFAGVLEENVRDRDLVARFGGEEFVLVYPDMSVKPSMEVIERIRAALARALARNDFPEFTCSFGVTHSSVGDSVESIIRVADAGLLTAKELGRNRVVYADEDLAAEVFGDDSGGVAATRAFSSMRPRVDPDPDPGPDPDPADPSLGPNPDPG